jgi:hypothetical protein
MSGTFRPDGATRRINSRQQHDARVAADDAAIKAALDLATAQAAKVDHANIKLFFAGTGRYSLVSALPALSSRFDTSMIGHFKGNAVLSRALPLFVLGGTVKYSG